MQGGKPVARELTKEEKAAAEAAAVSGKGAKNAPAKGKGAVEEKQPTPQEIEAAERAQAEREAGEARFQAEWDLLDDETRFFRSMEDPFKEPRVCIENKV